MIKWTTEAICQTFLMHQQVRKDWAILSRKTTRRDMPWLIKESKRTSFWSNWCSCRVNNSIRIPMGFKRGSSRRKAWELATVTTIASLITSNLMLSQTKRILIHRLALANWISQIQTNNLKARQIDEISWWVTKTSDNNLMKQWPAWISTKVTMVHMLNRCQDKLEEIKTRNSPLICRLWSKPNKSSTLIQIVPIKTTANGFLIWAVFQLRMRNRS